MFNIVAIFSRSRTKRASPFCDPLLRSANLSQSQLGQLQEDGLWNRLWKIISKCSVEDWSKMEVKNGSAERKMGLHSVRSTKIYLTFFLLMLFSFSRYYWTFTFLLVLFLSEKGKINRIRTKKENILLRDEHQNKQRVKREAKKFGKSVMKEVVFLVYRNI